MNKRPYLYVVASAVMFGLSAPLSKLLLKDIPPLVLAGLLYGGAFLGLTFYSIGHRFGRRKTDGRDNTLRPKDLGWLAGSILTGGILGPLCLLYGLAKISGYAASLLLNLEGIATALFAVLIFGENAGRRVWTALLFMTVAGIFLSWDPGESRFALEGTLLVLGAMVCWGLDNNLTRQISDKNPIVIARIKGLCSSLFSLGLAGLLAMKMPLNRTLVFGLVLGAFSYGLSLVLYIKALAGLGAFRAGAFFSVAPFVGVLASLLILPESATWVIAPGIAFMVFGVYLLVSERHRHHHRHEQFVHAHPHFHGDGHHRHTHEDRASTGRPHAHAHAHDEMDHVHGHWPDIHHRHDH